jgi:hypothetical protein
MCGCPVVHHGSHRSLACFCLSCLIEERLEQDIAGGRRHLEAPLALEQGLVDW